AASALAAQRDAMGDVPLDGNMKVQWGPGLLNMSLEATMSGSGSGLRNPSANAALTKFGPAYDSSGRRLEGEQLSNEGDALLLAAGFASLASFGHEEIIRGAIAEQAEKHNL